MNYWFWTYMIAVPVLVFAIRPSAPSYVRIGGVLFAILFCYGMMNLSIHLKWDLLQEAVNNAPDRTHEDLMDASADGANLIFTLILGWVPASIVVFFWWQVRRLWHRKTIGVRLKSLDGASRAVLVFTRTVRVALGSLAGLFILCLILMEAMEMQKRFSYLQ